MKTMISTNKAAALLLLSGWIGNVNAQSDGDVICVEGFIMDEYCINRGTLLDNQAVETLVGPEEHTLHCLVDVGTCNESPFHILEEDPAELSTPFGPGWAVTDNQPLMDLARSVGQCSTCTGEGDQEKGFRAAVRGEVVSAADKTISILQVALTGTDLCVACPLDIQECPDGSSVGRVAPDCEFEVCPTLSPSETPTDVPTLATAGPSLSPSFAPSFAPSAMPSLRPSAGPSNSPSMAPTGLSPTTGTPTAAAVTPAPTTAATVFATTEVPTAAMMSNYTNATVACMDYEHELEVPGLTNVTMYYIVNEATDDNMTMTMSVKIVYPGQGWVGFAVSPDGSMAGSSAVIGTIDVATGLTSVSNYFLASRPELLGEEGLMDASIIQTEEETVLEFTRPLDIGDENPINGTGLNFLLVAHGADNTLGYHAGRSSFDLTLSPCVVEEEPMMNMTMPEETTVGTVDNGGGVDTSLVEATTDEEETATPPQVNDEKPDDSSTTETEQVDDGAVDVERTGSGGGSEGEDDATADKPPSADSSPDASPAEVTSGVMVQPQFIAAITAAVAYVLFASL